MKKTKNKDQMVSDPVLEAEMKSLVDAPQTALVKTEDVRLETVRANTKTGSREIARALNGKFMSRTAASTVKTAKEVQTFLAEEDPDTGLSRQQSLLRATYKGALKAAGEPRALGNAVKAVEMLDEISGHAKLREEALTNRDSVKDQLRVVVIAPIETMMHKDVIDFDKKSEDKKQPSFAEVLDVHTNPVKA